MYIPAYATRLKHMPHAQKLGMSTDCDHVAKCEAGSWSSTCRTTATAAGRAGGERKASRRAARSGAPARRPRGEAATPRSICNVPWYSDVQAGELMASATTARLHADPVFQADLQAARQEVEALRARQAQPNGDCTLEEAALANRP